MAPQQSSSTLELLLKVAGYRKGTAKRRSSRTRRWSRTAQTLFASWAVLGQLGSAVLLMGEALNPPQGLAETALSNYGGNVVGTLSDAVAPDTHFSRGSMALGFAASAGASTSNPSANRGFNHGSSIAIGTLTNAAQYGSVAIGIGAVTSRENQIVLGASRNITGRINTYALDGQTTVTIPNLAGSSQALILANGDGTLQRGRFRQCIIGPVAGSTGWHHHPRRNQRRCS